TILAIGTRGSRRSSEAGLLYMDMITRFLHVPLDETLHCCDSQSDRLYHTRCRAQIDLTTFQRPPKDYNLFEPAVFNWSYE
ncbi:17853_t:CDS:1, partial [Acaulospora morrowiae]